MNTLETNYPTEVAGNATHNLTLYRAPSGALVFSAGTIFWPDALDSHNTQGITPDPNVQQAMVNLFAQMGIQPHTLQSGLVVGVLSNDHTAPQATIDPLSLVVTQGSTFTVKGTAADLGGGVVAGVEFSGDGGLTWHKASGWDNWSYTWQANKIGLTTLEVP